MAETKITGGDNLLSYRIVPRIETYYLVTEDNLRSLRGNNIFTDVFSFMGSLLWGGYFSVLIAINASSQLTKETVRLLLSYQKVFLVSALILSVLAILFLVITHTAIARIRKTTLPEEWQKTSPNPAVVANAKADARR